MSFSRSSTLISVRKPIEPFAADRDYRLERDLTEILENRTFGRVKFALELLGKNGSPAACEDYLSSLAGDGISGIPVII